MKSTELLSNFIWKFGEKFGSQVVTFVVTIILARILGPDIYGQIAIITAFITILSVFCDSGLGSSLIQKKNADDIDFSTVFYTNAVVGFTLYLVMFVAAPHIASYYDDSSMVPLIRALSLTLPFLGIKNVQQAYVSKNMMFKKFFFSTLSGTISSAVVGITVAVKGGGAWALVASNLALVVVDTVVLWITVPWRPKLFFSWIRLKWLFSYGWKLLASGFMETIYSNLRALIIGKRYTQTALAYYTKGKNFPDMIVSNVNHSIESVLFPALSREQDNVENVKNMTRRAIKTSVYVLAPLLMGLAAVAEPLVNILLGDEWLEIVPFMRIFCASLVFWPIHTANLNAIKALGRSDIILKQEIAKKVVGLIILVAAIPYGVLCLAYSLLVESFASQIINSWPNRKLIKYRYIEQLKDIFPCLLLAVFMAGCVYPVTLLGMGDFLTITVQVILGAAIYIIGSSMLKLDSFIYLWRFLSDFGGMLLIKNQQVK